MLCVRSHRRRPINNVLVRYYVEKQNPSSCVSHARDKTINSFIYFFTKLELITFVILFRSQKTPKCSKNIDDTLCCALCATFLFLPHFDIICDLNRIRKTISLSSVKK